MGSTSQTPFLELSQFADADKPTWRGDYNGDMGKIDVEIGNIAPSNGKRAVGIGELVLDIYDYGAINDAAVSSQTAFDAAYADAVIKSAGGTLGVVIKVPYGVVQGKFTVKSPRISFEGPGKIAGSITYINPVNDGVGMRVYAFVNNMGFVAASGDTNSYGVRVLGMASLEITGCVFETVTGVLLDYWGSLTSPTPGVTALSGANHRQQNKTIVVHHNNFKDCDYAIYGGAIDTTSWDTHADCVFSFNIVRTCFVGMVYMSGADGFGVFGNVCFTMGHNDMSNPTNKQRKSNLVYFGAGSNWITVSDNHLFEAGLSAIYMYRVNNCVISGNQIAWFGQLAKSPAILVVTYSGLGTNNPVPVVITNNLIDQGYGNGISVGGDSDVSKVTIHGNVIKLIGYSSLNVYYGAAYGKGALDTSDICKIFVASSNVSGWIDTDQNGAIDTSRGDICNIRGVMVSGYKRITESNFNSAFTTPLKTVTSGTPIIIGQVGGPYQAGNRHDSWNGRITILARAYTGTYSLTAIPRIAKYVFDTNGSAATVENMTQSGLYTVAVSDGANPAFTFTIDSATGNIIATPIDTTGGFTAQFSVRGEGFCLVGMNPSDYTALPLRNALDPAPLG